MDPSGAVAMHAPVGQVDTTLPHYQILQLVAGDPVALWLDTAQNRSLAAMRLCP